MKFFITNVFLSFKRTWIRIPSTDQDPEGHLKRFITDPDPNHMPKINSFNKQVGFQIPVPLNQTILYLHTLQSTASRSLGVAAYSFLKLRKHRISGRIIMVSFIRPETGYPKKPVIVRPNAELCYIFCRNVIIYPWKCLIINLCKFRQKICETFAIKMRQYFGINVCILVTCNLHTRWPRPGGSNGDLSPL